MAKGRAGHSPLVIVARVPVRAVPVNSAPTRSSARASRFGLESPSRAASHFRGIVRHVQRVRVATGIGPPPGPALRTGRTGVSPVMTRGAGRMLMASGLAARARGESRVSNDRAAKVQDSTGRSLIGPDYISPDITGRDQVGQRRGVLTDPAKATVRALTGSGHPEEMTISSAPMLRAEARIVRAVHDRPASRSGQAVRETHARRSDLGRAHHLGLARGRLLADGLHLALVLGRGQVPARPDRGLLQEARRAGAEAAVRGHPHGVLPSQVTRSPGSRTGAAHGAAGGPAVTDALNTSRLRAIQGFGSVARMNSAR